MSASAKTPSPFKENPDSQLVVKSINELLLMIFIHGFKGTDTTFGEFPQRMEHILTETIPGLKAECIVFPAYETKGELDKAVVRFADWLTTLTVDRENKSGLGSGSAKIVICGHSMGGLLAADSLREFANTRPDNDAPLWPKIVACIAFDTPYLGINPFVVKNSVTKVAEYANAATTIGSALSGAFAGFSAQKATTPSTPPAAPAAPSLWSKWAPAAYAVGGAVLAGAAAGGVYWKKDDLTQGFTWATDHMKYVGNLWDEATLEKRLLDLLEIEKEHGVIFRVLYTALPPKPPAFLTTRTFVVLPKFSSPAKNHFEAAKNHIAENEIDGHTGMFSAPTNDGYYQLGLTTTGLVREALAISKGQRPSQSRSPSSRKSTTDEKKRSS